MRRSPTTYGRFLFRVFAIILGSVLGLPAQPVDSLVRLAQQAHPSLNAIRLSIQQSEVQARSYSAWEAPRIGFDLRGLSPSNPSPFATGESMLGVEQMIPLFGQNRAMADAMALGRDVGIAQLDDTRRELALRVETEYYTLWALDRRLEINAENHRLASRLYASAETRLITNSGRQSDLLRLRVEIENLENEVQIIAQQRIAALARLNAILLRPSDTPVAIAAALGDPRLSSELGLDTALRSNPQLLRMEAMARMSAAQGEAERLMLLPMMMVRAGIEYMPEGEALRQGTYPPTGEGSMASEPGDVMRVGVTLGAMITIPTLPWSRNGASDRADAYEIESASLLAERDAMRLQMESMLRSSIGEARQAMLRIDYVRGEQIPLLERSLESLLSEFSANSTPFARVIDGYRELAMARMDLYMRQMDYAMALSMIRRLTGDRP